MFPSSKEGGIASGMAQSKTLAFELTNAFFKMLCENFSINYWFGTDDAILDDPKLQNLLDQTINWIQSK